MKRKNSGIDMTVGNPTGLLIRFAIPMLIGAAFDLMYNMVDAMVLGRFVSADALASVGATNATTGMMIMIGFGLTQSISILISQAWGAKDKARLRRMMGHAFTLCILAGIGLGVLAAVLAEPLMILLRTPESIRDGAVLYIRIVCGVGIARLFYNTSAAVLRAVGDSRAPLFFLMLSSMLNVILDLVLVIGFGMSIAGVAWATVIAQAVSAILSCVYMWRKYPVLRFSAEDMRLRANLTLKFGGLALPIALRDILLTGGEMVIAGVVNGFGEEIVAAYAVGGKVQQIAIILLSQIEAAFAVYVGQNCGAKRYDRIDYGLKKVMLISGTLTAISMAVLLGFGRPLSLLFVKAEETAVLAAAVQMLRVAALFLPAFTLICLYNAMLRSMGFVKPAVISSMLELVSKVGFSIALSGMIGPNGVWLASPMGWVIGLCMSAGYFYFGKWKQKALAAEG